MKNKSSESLSVCLYGLEGRVHKTMVLFLQSLGKNKVQVVDAEHADIDILDIDGMNARTYLDRCLARQPLRPIIVLSLTPVQIAHTFYVQKPATAPAMLDVLKKAQAQLQLNAKKTAVQKSVPPTSSLEAKLPDIEPTAPVAPIQAKADKPASANAIDAQQAMQTELVAKLRSTQMVAKHQAAMRINEQQFSAFIGLVTGVNFNNPRQWHLAAYQPKLFYQGYVQSAFRVARDKSKALKLQSSWHPLLIFPDSQEVYLAVDDKQLRVFAGLAVNAIANSTEKSFSLLALLESKQQLVKDAAHLQDMDAFLWKLACWTSKGRYPENLDLHARLALKHWPDFTRLMITPHAMRIAAFWVREPRSIASIIDTLKIKPQYVFVFVSAAYALGLIDKGVPLAEQPGSTAAGAVTPVGRVNKQGLLSRILHKLRG